MFMLRPMRLNWNLHGTTARLIGASELGAQAETLESALRGVQLQPILL